MIQHRLKDDAIREATKTDYEKWLDSDASPTVVARSKYYTAQEQVLGEIAFKAGAEWQAAQTSSAAVIEKLETAARKTIAAAYADRNVSSACWDCAIELEIRLNEALALANRETR